jgi:hypothetical protein
MALATLQQTQYREDLKKTAPIPFERKSAGGLCEYGYCYTRRGTGVTNYRVLKKSIT